MIKIHLPRRFFGLFFLATFFFFWILWKQALAGDLLTGSSSLIEKLVRNAHYWEDRNSPENAKRVWKRILESEPGEPHALAGLGSLYAGEGNVEEARKYLHKLNMLHPNDPHLVSLKAAIQRGKMDPSLLARARRETLAGNYLLSVESYRAYFKGIPPKSGSLALEYLETLSATSSGRKEALSLLSSLVRQHPGSYRYALVFARVLIAREETRREGISLLEKIQSRDREEKKIRKLWRQGLLWLNATPLDRPLYLAYLGFFPQDRKIQRKMVSIPVHEFRYRGFLALEKNHTGEAQVNFRKALEADKTDASSNYGMAVLLLRQGHYRQSLIFLRRAISLAPGNADRWKTIGTLDRYLDLVRRSQENEEKGFLRRAERDDRKALNLLPTREEAPAALVSLYLRAGRLNEVRRIGDRLISRGSTIPIVWEDVVRADLATDHQEEAESMVKRASKALPPRESSRIRAIWHEELGMRAQRKGNMIQAEKEFRRALAENTNDPWISYHLALLLLNSGREKEAWEQVEQFLATHPDSTNGLFARALIENREGQSKEALSDLSRIPLNQRTPAINKTTLDVIARLFMAKSRALAGQGHGEEASSWAQVATLLQTGRSGRRDPVFWENLGRVYAHARNGRRALACFQKAIQLSPRDLPLKEEASGWALHEKNGPMAKIWIVQGLAQDPNDPVLLERKGDLEISQNHFRRAFKAYRAAFDRLSASEGKEKKREIAAKIAHTREILLSRQTQSPFIEGMLGVTNYSQNSLFTYEELGLLLPLSGNPKNDRELLDPPSVRWFLHLLIMGDWFAYSYPGSPSGTNGLVNQSFLGADPAVGLRAIYETGFLDLDAGPAGARVFQTLTPVKTDFGAYVQGEWYQNLPAGTLDVFANYLGFLDYFFGQARFLLPVAKEGNEPSLFSLGPEAAGQGNYSYNAWQAGVALSIPVPSLNASLLLDGGLLRSNASVGWGGYEGLNLYFRVPL